MKAPIANLSALLSMIREEEGVKDNCLDLFDKAFQSVDQMQQTIRSFNEVISSKKSMDSVPQTIILSNL